MGVKLPSVETVFSEAIEIAAPAERAAYLDQACDGDASLRRHVESLLDAHIRSEGFLELPAVSPTVTIGPPPLAEGPDATIGPYVLLEKIGEGGMGTVYMAEQTRPVRRQVALKVIKPGMDSRQVVARFEAERQALALMDHPSIARVLDAGATASGRPYFVMELVRGIPITDYCDREGLTVAERLELFVLVCRAVQHAHQKGVIHRDLKPSNVLVTVVDGVPTPKVIDFGVAKATGGSLTERTLVTGFHQLVGTPLYMSPEQADLSSADVDTRSDIYALGVVLYELLTGSTPFDRARFAEAAFDEMRRIIREDEPPTPSTRLDSLGETLSTVSSQRGSDPRRLNRLVRGELDWIAMKALEKDRRRRYDTANDLAADVMRYLTDRPVEACPPSARYRLSKFTRRNRGALTTTVLLMAAIFAGAAASVWQAVRATRAELLATEASADSTAVLDYLVADVFGAAAPAKSRGRTLTLPDLLSAGNTAIPSRFRGRPLAEAASREALCQGYLFLGEFQEAEAQALLVVELRSRALGPEHPRSLAAVAMLLKTRHALISDRDLQQANIPLSHRLVESRRRVLGPDHPDTLRSMLNHGILLLHHGDFDKASSWLQEVYAAQVRVVGPEQAATLETLVSLSRAFLESGNFVAAEDAARRAHEGLCRALGPDNYRTTASLPFLARAERGLGWTEKAIQHYVEAADGSRAAYGLESNHVRGYVNELFGFLREKRDAVTMHAFCDRWLRAILAKPAGADPYQKSQRSLRLVQLSSALTNFPEPIPFDSELVDRAAKEIVALRVQAEALLGQSPPQTPGDP